MTQMPPMPPATPSHDEVDDLVAAWHRERADLPVEPMHIWSRILRLAVHLDEARRVAHARHGLEGWEFDVLAALRKEGAPYTMSPGQLLKQTHVTSGTMTNRVDRLVSRGFVRRQADPNDGRVVRVVLTDDGREAVDAALEALLEAEENLLAHLDAEKRDRLAAALRGLLLAQGDVAAH
ncbi:MULTISPECIES: MarR family winged helix-turn-helix transcriptional regulator [unclassified Luteococcus]|uniref:MarR family winged helix-turn-helix transcriptional regulator n=1 Tax=unclassified Luteococcus TaxID=2639923 RepID=UPI00313C5FEF